MEFPPLYAGDSERRDVCFGSLADTALRPRHDRYSPQSGHSSAQFARPLSANSGRRGCCRRALFGTARWMCCAARLVS